MLEIKSFTFGSFGTNTYVVSGLPSVAGESPFVLVVDPACSTEYEQQVLLTYLQSLQARCPEPLTVSLVATHGHLDHLWGAPWACGKWHTPVLMHHADIPMAEGMQAQYNLFGISATPRPFPIRDIASAFWLSDTYQRLFPRRIQIIETPGHTPGGICLYFPEDNILISGDTLFQMGYGRTDLPGGNTMQLIQSLQLLFSLPPEVQVFPGHGEPTTIGDERR